jgi:Caspase domain
MPECGHDEQFLAHHDCGNGEPRIHALVIGVSQYQKPRSLQTQPLPPLHGPALAASRFAKYLINEFRDPEQRTLGTLRLLVSPLRKERADLRKERPELRLHSPAATTRAVGRALQDWADDCDRNRQNLAIFYIAGHGLVLGKRASMVFLGDALQQGNRYQGSISLETVADVMADCSAKDNIYVYDCCAVRKLKTMGLVGAISLDPDRFLEDENPEKPRRETAVFITAARIGTSAYAIGEDGTLLSRGLLGLFRGHTGDDALLRTAGEIFENRYYGITVGRLVKDLPNRLEELIAVLGEEKGDYEPTVTVDRAPARPLTVPDPPPTYPVVLKGLHQGRALPVRLKIIDPKGTHCDEPDVPDEWTLSLPAGVYYVYVEGAGESGSFPLPINVDRPFPFLVSG